MNDKKSIITPKKASEYLKVTKQTLVNWEKEGKIKAYICNLYMCIYEYKDNNHVQFYNTLIQVHLFFYLNLLEIQIHFFD